MQEALQSHLTATAIVDDDGSMMARVALYDLHAGHLDNACRPAIPPRVRVAHALGEGRRENARRTITRRTVKQLQEVSQIRDRQK